MNTRKANQIFRRSIIGGFFEPELLNLDFKKSSLRHPTLDGSGLMQSDLLYIFFDIETGSDYPDGDEWFIVDMLFPYDIDMPDTLKGVDYFTTLSSGENTTYWHHRELIRFKYNKSKKLVHALDFLESKYKELHMLLEPLRRD